MAGSWSNFVKVQSIEKAQQLEIGFGGKTLKNKTAIQDGKGYCATPENLNVGWYQSVAITVGQLFKISFSKQFLLLYLVITFDFHLQQLNLCSKYIYLQINYLLESGQEQYFFSVNNEQQYILTITAPNQKSWQVQNLKATYNEQFMIVSHLIALREYMKFFQIQFTVQLKTNSEANTLWVFRLSHPLTA
eukprot:TRINITY_DN2472_c0_g2_i4.p2 TRINITY_DN2472_c0_g2~~TRINITY_DN2472_c0_g2_i4.p2  ORF type:complete len:190 (-),score=2.25 TRINITY_DN2472_c0_g2_i4:193-762(-)